MGKKKLSTAEILAAARAEAAKKNADPSPDQAADVNESASSDSGSQEPAAASQESQESAKKPAGGGGKSPASTKDILAAARAQAAGAKEGDKPSKAAAPSGGKKSAGGGGKTPGSTKDILAAARAQAGGSGQSEGTAVDSPAAGKPASPKSPTAKPAGERPSVQEMLKAVREGKPAGAAATAASGEPDKPTLPARPQKPPLSKPAAKKPGQTVAPTRRNFVVAVLMAPAGLFSSAFSSAWTLAAAATTAFTLGLARFMMPNVLVEPPSNFKIGSPDDYPLGTVSTKWKSEFGVWIVHVEYDGKDVIYALSTICTHLGCTPNWLESEQKFKCPCHGSGFYKTGINFEGPAPRPLERYGIRVAEDGMLEVEKSLKYQEEMGQWTDATSYVELA
jgi:cytochrome b6-f complex iron-sulfur subunit